jgi:predicted secreted hydrolase
LVKPLLLALVSPALLSASYPAVTPGRHFSFPQDHGAHPEFRSEWWYVTGWLSTGAGKPVGFQVTFFRIRPRSADANPSAFAPKQIIVAHAALSDPLQGHILSGSSVAREGFGLASAQTGDAAVNLRDWHFNRHQNGHFSTHVATNDFDLSLDLEPTGPVLLEGQGGYSRKGPGPSQASYYYSLPHLAVKGDLIQAGTRRPVTGSAWLDREWSSSYLSPEAVGWDWTGLQLDNGSALMAFRMRKADGTTYWSEGSFQDAKGHVLHLGPNDISFTTVRRWRSIKTGAVYPVEQLVTIHLPSGERKFPLTPLMLDQELDWRRNGMPIYWEGAVTTSGGRGYLEMTGYAGRPAL